MKFYFSCQLYCVNSRNDYFVAQLHCLKAQAYSIQNCILNTIIYTNLINNSGKTEALLAINKDPEHRA